MECGNSDGDANNDDRDAIDGDKVAAECACAKRVCVRGKACCQRVCVRERQCIYRNVL